MEITELRIGNLYESTKFRLPVTCKLSDLVEIYHMADGAEVDKYHVLSVFAPIPITEDWVIAFGFKKYELCFPDMYVKDGCGFSIKYRKENGFTVGYRYGHVYLKYVHQLQDLYFALMGSELIYKTQIIF